MSSLTGVNIGIGAPRGLDSTGTTTSFESRGYRFTTTDAMVLGITPDYEIGALIFL